MVGLAQETDDGLWGIQAMKTKGVKSPGGRALPAEADPFELAHEGSRTILLISRDERLYGSLRSFANRNALMVVRTGEQAAALSVLRATKALAVLVDLDLPGHTAREITELLLDVPNCPSVILVTGQPGRVDMRTAIGAGSLLNKHDSPCHLFERIEQALERGRENRPECNANQRVLLRWLRPSECGEQNTPVYRFWGINE